MRALIAIGCNTYQHLSPLAGAESDAQRIYDTLTRDDVGDYAPATSRLLLSPTLDELRTTIRGLLFSHEPIDTFTFFFAGHGVVHAGSFHMAVRDSRPGALSASALSLSELFRNLAESTPSQSNIIIDACESGGLVSDLGTLLKANVLGDAGTPGITLLATSAQNQYAAETENGGEGTNAILDCIEGRDFIQDNSTALDLAEIGRHISDKFRSSGQTPLVWGLNLYGAPRFCRNPFANADPARPLREVIQAWPPASDALIQSHYDELWRAYASVSGNWEAVEFSRTISKLLTHLISIPGALTTVSERLGDAAFARAELSNDPFRPAQIAAAFAVCLLPHLAHVEARQIAERFVSLTSASLIEAGTQLTTALAADRFALLATQGGVSDLFYLPLRAVKILGWVGSLNWVLSPQDAHREQSDHIFTSMLRTLLAQYTGSVTAMSDAQAPYWAIAIANAARLRLTDESEQLAGLAFHSLIRCEGNLARIDLSPEDALTYLMARRENNYSRSPDLIERPNETLSVLLKAAIVLNLIDAFDPGLWKLDGVNFSAYVNDTFSEFGATRMSGGKNFCWTIGEDVFRVSDFAESWPHTPTPETNLEAALVVLASLLFPDRIPWFCLESA